jgi:glycosyltransferase involved in cell wall biosynthesis
MKAIKKAKKKDPSIKVVQLIADLIEFAVNNDATCIQKMYNSWQVKQNNRLRRYIDGYILLTEQMRDKLNITKPYIVMEGIAAKRDSIIFSITRDNDVKTILYTGSMNTKYGILELLEAFSKIGMSNYRLVLCGVGNDESIISIIKEYCKRDSRIVFLGKVPHDEVLDLQANSTVLVNPRRNNEEFTKYSFPSKNLEYLSSGTPLVAYKLDGIPDEYDDYIYYVPDNDPVTLAKRLIEVCEMPEEQRKAMGLKAREFVNNNKNPKIQTKRILDFIKAELIGNA